MYFPFELFQIDSTLISPENLWLFDFLSTNIILIVSIIHTMRTTNFNLDYSNLLLNYAMIQHMYIFDIVNPAIVEIITEFSYELACLKSILTYFSIKNVFPQCQ